jgi:hypothetical protein
MHVKVARHHLSSLHLLHLHLHMHLHLHTCLYLHHLLVLCSMGVLKITERCRWIHLYRAVRCWQRLSVAVAVNQTTKLCEIVTNRLWSDTF